MVGVSSRQWLGMESQAGEAPDGQGRPLFPHPPWHGEATLTPSRAELPRAAQEPLCKVTAFALPPAGGTPSPFPATLGYWRVCPASDRGSGPGTPGACADRALDLGYHWASAISRT